MSEPSRSYLIAAGAITPIGANALQTSTSVRAGLNWVQETDILNRNLTPIKMARVPDEALSEPDPELAARNLPERQLRLLKLASVALNQLTGKLPAGELLPLYLALPEHLPGLSMPLAGNFIEQLVLQSGVALNTAESRVASIGRAGGLHAVNIAQQYFAETGNDYLLIGGVDSYWDPYLRAKLDAEDRLNVQGALDGFFPGEGAAFLLLGSERVKDQWPGPHVSLFAPGLADEPGHRYSDQPYLGEGLAEAARRAFEQAAPGVVESVWTSMIYDSLSHKELGVALIRNNKHISEQVKMHHPVDCFGDLGAAMGCTLLGLVAMAAGKQSGPRHHLVCCASDLAPRAAIRVDVG